LLGLLVCLYPIFYDWLKMTTSIITSVMTITAKTLSGRKVTVTSFDVIIENGQPLIVFFVKDENGQFGLFNQNQLTDYAEV
jgi:hypothetical protein